MNIDIIDVGIHLQCAQGFRTRLFCYKWDDVNFQRWLLMAFLKLDMYCKINLLKVLQYEISVYYYKL